jgi:hypothetical protein
MWALCRVRFRTNNPPCSWYSAVTAHITRPHTLLESQNLRHVLRFIAQLRMHILYILRTTMNFHIQSQKQVALAHLGERQTEAIRLGGKLWFYRTISGGTVFDPQKRHFFAVVSAVRYMWGWVTSLGIMQKFSNAAHRHLGSLFVLSGLCCLYLVLYLLETCIKHK